MAIVKAPEIVQYFFFFTAEAACVFVFDNGMELFLFLFLFFFLHFAHREHFPNFYEYIYENTLHALNLS